MRVLPDEKCEAVRRIFKNGRNKSTVRRLSRQVCGKRDQSPFPDALTLPNPYTNGSPQHHAVSRFRMDNPSRNASGAFMEPQGTSAVIASERDCSDRKVWEHLNELGSDQRKLDAV